MQVAIFWLLLLSCLTPWMSAPVALVMGFVATALGLHPGPVAIASWVKQLLGIAIVAMGFGVQLQAAVSLTGSYLGLIVASIVLTLVAAWLLGRAFRVHPTTSYLIGSGTAICGGSAIAAIGPAIHAKADQLALAMATVFTLNAVALVVFPLIGHALDLDQHTFGVWAAIAIHDTSSVVGAAQAYGNEALQVATTLKLARALWIVPLALLSAWWYQRMQPNAGRVKVSLPWFIVGYVLAMLVHYVWPQFTPAYDLLFHGGKQLLVVCLFLIGASMSWTKLKAAGGAALLLAVLLWLLIGAGSLAWLLLAS